MSKEMVVIVLGIFVAALPYLGIPWSLKTPLFVVAGLLVALFGFLLRGKILSEVSKERVESHSYVESSDVE
jgi:hypothetical protein